MTVPDVVVIGSGLVGACCAYELARAGVQVSVVERGHLASGTTAACEGNILISDKPPGAELALGLASLHRWRELVDELGDGFEFEPKGGVVVASQPGAEAPLLELATAQRGVGVDARPVEHRELHELEPHLADDLEAGVHYPQDAQVQPVLAARAALRGARRLGATILPATTVVAIDADGRHGLRVRTSRGQLTSRWVVNAAGPWSTDVAALAGAALPVRPRRGHILVTEPVGRPIGHKVYEADYVTTLTTDSDDAQVSSVVEGTRGGTVLLGSSREFVGFDRRIDPRLVRRIARRAVRLFPILGDIALLRSYVGFRPWVPDHLPIIGPDPRVDGLLHATGHEGAGVCLAPGTAQLIVSLVTGSTAPVAPTPFAADRPGLHATTEPSDG